jgi:predicted 3-demethylubiquinone-9 3-methyltransferase (glyoxalase superfamily)
MPAAAHSASLHELASRGDVVRRNVWDQSHRRRIKVQKISTYLWFDNNAEEAMNFYTSVFKNSRIVSILRYPDNSEEEHLKGMRGKVLHGVFELEGVRFFALDGGPQFKFNESVSLYVECESQEEVDQLWAKLSAVPEAEACGWLKDKFGLSWQIIPRQLDELMSDTDPNRSQAVMLELLQMKKLDLAKLVAAYESAGVRS